MPRHRCAILDDYQNVVLKVTDWSKVSGDLDIKVFNQHLGSQENVIKALQGFDIVCAMRERTAFPRAVIEKLPDLKLLITTGCAMHPSMSPPPRSAASWSAARRRREIRPPVSPSA
jgi:D-3-phosphoglycerate dehydrogenase